MLATVRPHQFDPVIMIKDFAGRRKAHSGAPRGRAGGLPPRRGRCATIAGRLRKVETFQVEFARVGGYDLPASRIQVVSQDGAAPVRRMVLSNHTMSSYREATGPVSGGKTNPA